jgi:2-dehydropantoate 2-reductase
MRERGRMKIAIVGAGAMGSMTGGLLREAGNEVFLCTLNQPHVEQIRKRGLVIEGIGGERVIPIEATTKIEEIGFSDLLILFVKSYDTEAASRTARRIAGENTIILTLQNGIGNIEILEKYFGKMKVLGGTTDAAATLVEPGRVRHTAFGNIYIGELNGIITPLVEQMVFLFNQSGFKCYATDNVIGMIWTKLILNLAINPLGTILRVKCEGLINNEYSKILMKQIILESLQIAGKKGITLLYEDMVQAAYALSEKNAASYNSMAQDFFKGKKTEIDFMSGAIVKEGKKVGVNAPLNEAMALLVKALETTAFNSRT